MPSRNDSPPTVWDTHGTSGNVSANLMASSSAFYPKELNPWVSNVSEHTSPDVMSESQTPSTFLDSRCQSGPSARNSCDSGEGRFSKNSGADEQRLQISDSHFDKFTTSATFVCWKIIFKTEVCFCWKFPTEAMQWIKEAELVDLVDRFGTEPNHPFYAIQKKGQFGGTKSPKRGPFPSWKTDRLFDLRLLSGHWEP